MRVFTLGYEKTPIQNYTDLLMANGVGCVLDVRETPWSYNRVYTKHSLVSALDDSGISYKHLRDCGNPKENRRTAKTAAECLLKYREHLAENMDCLTSLLEEIRTADAAGRPACLTCFEKHPHDCHRGVLIELLVERVPDLQVVHLIH